jgi:hypothetical protein
LPAQFQAGVFIKSDALNIGYREARLIQAISKGGCRECLVVLYPRKSLLLSGCDNSTALHQAAGRIVVASGNAYDVQKTALGGFTTSIVELAVAQISRHSPNFGSLRGMIAPSRRPCKGKSGCAPAGAPENCGFVCAAARDDSLVSKAR